MTVTLLLLLTAPVPSMVLAAASHGLTPLQGVTQKPEIYVLTDGKPEGIDIEIPLGATRAFTIANGYAFWTGTLQPLPLDNPPSTIQWSVTPAGKGVTVNASGQMSVASNATPGMYTLRAVIPEKTMTREVRVYDLRRNPVVGTWHEDAQISCGDSRESQPSNRMGELIFWARGSFTATWRPFETRIDYSGTYKYTEGSGAINLTVPGDRQNYRPPDISPSGTASIDAKGRLILRGIWLGSPPDYVRAPGPAAAVKACGHVFVR